METTPTPEPDPDKICVIADRMRKQTQILIEEALDERELSDYHAAPTGVGETPEKFLSWTEGDKVIALEAEANAIRKRMEVCRRCLFGHVYNREEDCSMTRDERIV